MAISFRGDLAMTQWTSPFAFLGAGALAGVTISFIWHCVMYPSSPFKWWHELHK
jgi:hypothetical protein